jgi:hypothetical protein
VLWVYLLVLRWRRSVAEAFLAAALLGLSWEFSYHARWIAPDLVMTSFAALTMLFVMQASRRHDGRRALYGAAIAAGLAAGTKYQCALLLLPILMEALWARRRQRVPAGVLRSVLPLLAVFAGTFIATTPAVLLDTGRVVRWILYVLNQYKSGDHGGYSVPAGLTHLWRMLVYLGADFFSTNLAVALGGSLFVLLGTWGLIRESRWQAALFLSFPTIYLLYMSTQRVFIVRNVLVVTPFLAVLGARGVSLTFVWLRGARVAWLRGARHALVAVAIVAVVINAAWLYRAARSIVAATPQRALSDLAGYVAIRPKGTVFASVAVRSALAAGRFDISRLAVRAGDAREVAFYPYDWLGDHSSNVWRAARTWFGPFELNWNRYNDWAGFQRIVLATAGRARALNIQLQPLPDVPAVGPK